MVNDKKMCQVVKKIYCLIKKKLSDLKKMKFFDQRSGLDDEKPEAEFE